MKKLKFHYRTAFRFQPPVYDHSFSVRCVPSTNAIQKITILSRYVRPADSLNEVVDGFGNHRYIGHMQDFHQYFAYEVIGIAVVDGMKVLKEPLSPIYKYPTSYTMPGKRLEEFSKSMSPLKGNRFQRAIFMMGYLYEHFEYVSGTTNIYTTAEEAMEQGKGVCQDYAHIFIALCRMNQIPARYVVGMMIGEGYTHAWVEIYLEDGWYGLDPTNNLQVDDYYIKIAHGRDYSDCVVDGGVFRGVTTQEQEIFVKVEEMNKGDEGL